MKQERRKVRSPHAGHALQHWLSGLAERRQLDHAVLADAQGLVVAASGDVAAAEEIAAHAPVYIQRENQTTYDRFALDGQRFYLCIVGDSTACAAAITEARTGINRIFAEQAAA